MCGPPRRENHPARIRSATVEAATRGDVGASPRCPREFKLVRNADSRRSTDTVSSSGSSSQDASRICPHGNARNRDRRQAGDGRGTRRDRELCRWGSPTYPVLVHRQTAGSPGSCGHKHHLWIDAETLESVRPRQTAREPPLDGVPRIGTASSSSGGSKGGQRRRTPGRSPRVARPKRPSAT